MLSCKFIVTRQKGDYMIEWNRDLEELITCPYCGSEVAYSGDLDYYNDDESSGLIFCDFCKKTYEYQINVNVSYCSRKRDDLNG